MSGKNRMEIKTRSSQGFNGHERTLEEARNYESGRFEKRKRGRKLAKIDRAFAQRLFEGIGVEGGIVDVPCGSGRFYDVFSSTARFVMVDYSENMLKVAQEKHGKAENVVMIRGNIERLPLGDNCVDLSFCMRFFHHLDNEQLVLGTLKELARVSKKYVAFSFYNKNCYRYISRRVRGKKVTGYYFSFHRILKLAKDAGLALYRKQPKFNLVEQQCLVVFEKT